MTTVEERMLIEDTLYRYASCIDSANPDGLVDVLHPDLWAQYGNADPVEGADTVIGWIRDATKTCVWQHHLLSVYHVDVEGDRATRARLPHVVPEVRGRRRRLPPRRSVPRRADPPRGHLEDLTAGLRDHVGRATRGRRRLPRQRRGQGTAGSVLAVTRAMAAYRLLDWGGPAELVEVPVPEPLGRQVLLEVRAVGLCHSDLFVMTCEPGTLPYELPLTLGHEVAGRVVAVGGAADPALVGRDGVVHGVWSCGECHNCRRGRDNHCVALAGRAGCGLGHDGGLAEYVLLPDERHFVPADGIAPAVLAPLADAGLTAYHAIRAERDALAGDCSAVVIGVGGLGHLAVQILRAVTTAQVVAVDSRPEALRLATELGAHRTGPTVEQALGGTGADVVLDFVGSDETMVAGASALVPGGRLVVVGGARGTLIVGKGLALPLGWQVNAPFWGTREDLVAVVELARRGLLTPVVEEVPFGDVARGYDRLHDGSVTGRLVVVPERAA